MSKQLTIMIAVVGVLCQTTLSADECVLKARKPVKVAGALCGTVVSIDIGDCSGGDIVLSDQAGVLVTSVSSDSVGAFKFPPLPNGKYQIDVPGFSMYMNHIELTAANTTKCKQPLILYVGLRYCSGGYVSRKWDYGRFPDGPPPRNVSR